jgi:hypothetical protein
LLRGLRPALGPVQRLATLILPSVLGELETTSSRRRVVWACSFERMGVLRGNFMTGYPP